MLWICVAVGLCFGVFLPLFGYYQLKKTWVSVTAKGLATCCALAVAIAAAVMGGGRLWLCVAALACCVAADVLLEGSFMLGMGAFICGHMWYILWFAGRVPLSLTHLLLFICLAAAAGMFIWRWRERIGDKLMPFAAYAVVLSVMGACGIACYQEASLAGLCGAFGAALFFISDIMVGRHMVMPSSRSFGAAAMVVYEAAQLMLAASAAATAGMI